MTAGTRTVEGAGKEKEDADEMKNKPDLAGVLT